MAVEIKLVVIGGIHAGKEIPVRRAKFVIGRSKECQLRPGCNLVSRRHCAILLKDKRILVEDLNSTNGTFLNGNEIEGPQALNHGDHLSVGTFDFEVHVFGAVGSGREPEVSATPGTIADALVSAPTKGGAVTGQEIGIDLEELDTAASNENGRKAEYNNQEQDDQEKREEHVGGAAAFDDEDRDGLSDLDVLEAEVLSEENERPNTERNLH